jgi:hypothetical protein
MAGAGGEGLGERWGLALEELLEQLVFLLKQQSHDISQIGIYIRLILSIL